MGAALHIFPVLTVVLYLGATVAFVRLVLPGCKEKVGLGRSLLAAGALFHCASMLAAYLGSSTLSQGYVETFPFTLSLISCVVVICFLLVGQRLRIAVLGAVIAPLASFFLLASGVLFHFQRQDQMEVPVDVLLWSHIGLTVLGHAGFVLAFGVSIVLILQESMLKNKRITSLQRKLPSLRLLDLLNGRLLAAGFICMACGVLLGFAFGFIHQVELNSLSTRFAWSFLTLLIYALLLSARLYRGLRGRRAAWFSVAGFCTVLASFVCSSLIGDQFHGF